MASPNGHERRANRASFHAQEFISGQPPFMPHARFSVVYGTTVVSVKGYAAWKEYTVHKKCSKGTHYLSGVCPTWRVQAASQGPNAKPSQLLYTPATKNAAGISTALCLTPIAPPCARNDVRVCGRGPIMYLTDIRIVDFMPPTLYAAGNFRLALPRIKSGPVHWKATALEAEVWVETVTEGGRRFTWPRGEKAMLNKWRMINSWVHKIRLHG